MNLFGKFKVDDLPILVFDNFFNEDEVSDIMHELRFYNKRGKLQAPEKTGSAMSPNGGPLKRNSGIFLDSLYTDKTISDIWNHSHKLHRFCESFSKENLLFSRIAGCKHDILISYYDNSNEYKPHTDGAFITAICWFFEKPKKFQGGDISFYPVNDEDKKCTTVECEFNRMVMFPSVLTHGVSSVMMNTFKDKNKGLGRYAISYFFHACYN